VQKKKKELDLLRKSEMKKEPKVVAARWFIGVVVACHVPVWRKRTRN